ncbi:MAG: hypothetical protein V4695_00115 [Pseudomonadota bacterium]
MSTFQPMFTPISGTGVDVTAMGAQVGLVAASKKIRLLGFI